MRLHVMQRKRGIAIAILSVRPSVYLSVCLFVTRVDCDKVNDALRIF